MAGALERLSKFGFPLKTNDATRAYFGELAKLESGSDRAELIKIAEGSPAALERAANLSPAWNAMLRTTCVATQLEGGHAMNALPQLAAANVNCRVLPDDSPEYVESTLQKVFADNQVNLKVAGEVCCAGPASPANPALMKAIARVTDTLWPGVPVVPIMLMAATDGLYLRSAGIPTYGVQGFFMDRNDIRAHGRDERLGVTSFYEGQTFLYELVKVLTTI